MADWFAATKGSLKEGFRQSGLTWLVVAALFCAALLLRLPGYSGRPLWIDELWRAVLILDPGFWREYFFSPTVESAITSFGYAFFVKLLGAFRVSPDILRLSSLIPGVLAVLAAFFLTRRAGGGVALALAAGLVFALNSNFINYSREMKPYMFEVLVHMAALYALLAVLQAPRPTIRTWLLYFLVLLFAIFSTATAVFLLPASGLTLFLRFLTGGLDKDARNKNLVICIVLFAAIGLAVVALYYFVWRYGADGSMLSIWAAGFSQSGGYLRFFTTALMQMWRASFDTPGMPMEADLALAFLVAVLISLVASRRALKAPVLYLLLFYLALAVTVCLVNLAKIWPLGAARVNLFLYAYLIMFLFLLGARLPFSDVAARVCLLAVGLVLLWHVHSSASQVYFRRVAEVLRKSGAPIERSDLVIEDFSTGGAVGRAILADCSRQKTLVIADSSMSTAVAYYTKYDAAHRQGAALLIGPCVRYARYTEAYLQPAETKAALSKILPGASHAWFIHSHLGDSDLAALRRVVETYGRVTNLRNYEGAGYFELIVSGQDDLIGLPRK